jgi:formamidopyrimidine-DNA glycosylase
MKMTGHIMCGEYLYNNTVPDRAWRPKNNDEANPLNDPFNRFIHFVCTITKGSAVKHLVMSDMRKFGKVTLIEESDPHQSAELSVIGPEPLDDSFTFSDFQSRLQGRTPTPIKQTLMDQSRIAGIGNIYSDEILWHAGVHPESAFSAIPQEIQKQMYDAMKDILRKGIDFGGDSMSDYRNIEGKRGAFQGEHKAYRKTKEPCQKDSCTGVISRMVIGGRSSHFCPVHQQLYIQKK